MKIEVKSRDTTKNSLQFGAVDADLLAGFGFLGAGGHTAGGLRTCCSDLGVTHPPSSAPPPSPAAAAVFSPPNAVFIGSRRGNSPTATTSDAIAAERQFGIHGRRKQIEQLAVAVAVAERNPSGSEGVK